MSRKIAVLAALAGVIVLAMAVPASASMTQLSGNQTLVDPNDGTYLMSGSLVGPWYTDSVACHEIPGAPGETWPCTGTEHFVGCIDESGDGTCDQEPPGRLDFVFNYTGSPVGNGRCYHRIVGGSDAFAEATGSITMKDRLGSCGLVVTTYRGHISLP